MGGVSLGEIGQVLPIIAIEMTEAEFFIGF